MENCGKSVNPSFIPYLEKHRIYELFHHIAEAVAMAMPNDHTFFIRNHLLDLSEVFGKSRIILITPPQIDALKLATLIQEGSTMRIISLKDMNCEDNTTTQDVAYKFNDIVVGERLARKGWILYDFPRNCQEATYLQKKRMLPTHTFEICPSPEKFTPNDAWCENIKNWKHDELRKAMANHKRVVFGLHHALKSTYKKVPVEGRSMEELAEGIRKMAKYPVSKGAPLIPRVVLVGTRGSKRRTVAKTLTELNGIVHVDLEEMMLGAENLQNDTGEMIRRLKERKIEISFKIIISMVQARLLRPDCMRKGWVLTGFPRDLGDLVALDNLQTPPNKVIFLSIDNTLAVKRLQNRKVNIYNGKVLTVKQIKADPFEDMEEYLTHPRDLIENVLEEQEEFSRNIKAMLAYCGENCDIVDAGESEDLLAEKISKLIGCPGSVVPVRRLGEVQDEETELEQLRFTLVSTQYPSWEQRASSDAAPH